MMHLPTQVHVCLFVCDVPVFRHCPVGPACHSFVPISVSHFMAPISSNGPSGEPHDVRCVSGGEHVTLSVSPNSGHVIFIVVECSASSCKQLHLGYRPPGRVISNLTRSQHRHLAYALRELSAHAIRTPAGLSLSTHCVKIKSLHACIGPFMRNRSYIVFSGLASETVDLF